MMQDPRRGESGQMLLLTAIILAIGFIALASMAARIEQIPGESELAQEDQFFTEVDLVAGGVAQAMDILAREYTVDLSDDNFTAALEGALAHLVHVERGRGFIVYVGTIDCSDVSGDVQLETPITIASINNQVSLKVTRSYASPITC